MQKGRKLTERKGKMTKYGSNIKDIRRWIWYDSWRKEEAKMNKRKRWRDRESLWRKDDVMPLGPEGLQDEWCKSRHLRYYSLKIRPRLLESPLEILPTQDKTQHELTSLTKITLAEFLYYLNSSCQYMRCNWFIRDFIIHKLSNFVHNLDAIFSFETFLNILSLILIAIAL